MQETFDPKATNRERECMDQKRMAVPGEAPIENPSKWSNMLDEMKYIYERMPEMSEGSAGAMASKLISQIFQVMTPET